MAWYEMRRLTPAIAAAIVALGASTFVGVTEKPQQRKGGEIAAILETPPSGRPLTDRAIERLLEEPDWREITSTRR